MTDATEAPDEVLETEPVDDDDLALEPDQAIVPDPDDPVTHEPTADQFEDPGL